MRLIDADAIHINITGGRMNGKVEFAKAIEEAIKEAPTIEAVPISFILEQIELLEKLESVWSAGTLRDLVLDWQKQEEAEQC